MTHQKTLNIPETYYISQHLHFTWESCSISIHFHKKLVIVPWFTLDLPLVSGAKLRCEAPRELQGSTRPEEPAQLRDQDERLAAAADLRGPCSQGGDDSTGEVWQIVG